MKKLIQKIIDWADLLLIFPISLAIVVALSLYIMILDPTAGVWDIGNLQILALNVSLYALVSGLGYLGMRLNLGYDPIGKDWLKDLTPGKRTMTHIALFVFQTALAAIIILRNL